MKLLFVCSGNICRSPMAERLSVARADRLGLDIQARSASTLGLDGRRAARNAVRVCREVGIDLSDHRSRPLTDELVAWADYILVMEVSHAAHVREFFPTGGDKVMLMGPLAGVTEIPDPVGGWWWTFRSVRRQLERAIDAFLVRAAR